MKSLVLAWRARKVSSRWWFAMAIGLWLVWLAVQGVTALMLGVEEAEVALAWQTLAWVGLLSMAWLGCWAAVDWLRNGSPRWHAHALLVAGALWMDTLWVNGLVPLTWFALGWDWSTGVTDAARMVLLLATVAAHLVVMGQPLFPGRVAVAGAMVLGITLSLVYVYQQASLASELDWLPYEPQVLPGRWMVRQGQPTEEALEQLWASPW